MKRMQQLIDDAEFKKKNSKQKEVSLPSSSGSSNMASKSSFCSSGILQNDDPTKKRKGPLGPLEKAFHLNAKDELHSEITRLFNTRGLSFNIARNPHYVRVFNLATQRTIPGYLPHEYNLLRTSLLQKEKAHIGKLLEPTKAAWKQKGAINCEGEYKDKAFISKLLINVIKEVGHQMLSKWSPIMLLFAKEPGYSLRQRESKMWDVGVYGFDSMDMVGAAILEIANLSLDEHELESVIFTNEGGVRDETDMDV
ncbi:hypothetical protein ZIOFF_057924 [Zingiber officinale]|uniref:Uncharacterized protein n=1 Tax=Zingiber officinale TaxID=94328 RepID=A0A8J5F7T7_ZINOF|nr:hypothetical protein ZIOFF_057924 [Zingiber officinale]